MSESQVSELFWQFLDSFSEISDSTLFETALYKFDSANIAALYRAQTDINQ